MADAWGVSWGGAWATSWHGSDAPVASVSGGAGGWWGTDHDPAENWKKRRRKINELDEIIRRAAGQIPDDVPEAVVAKAAVAKIEKAVDVVSEPPPRVAVPLPPEVDLRALAAEVTAVRAALQHYKARRALEEDDEDILLLLA